MTGLIHVREAPGSAALEGRDGAYFNAYAVAADVAEFTQRVVNWVADQDLVIVEIDDLKSFDEIRGDGLTTAACELADKAAETGQLQVDTFQRYWESDADGDSV